MTVDDYHHSFRVRWRVLFSPLRLALFIGSVVWGVVLNAIFMANLGSPAWAGPVSVIPIMSWLAWLLVTDARRRREAKRRVRPGR